MPWRPSKKAIALAEQLHHDTLQPDRCGALQRLAWQTKVQALLHEALSLARQRQHATPEGTPAHDQVTPPGAGLPVQTYRRLVALREWMASPACDCQDVDALARHAGMSRTTLQRHFPAVAQGMTVAAYGRQQRLLRAREVMEREGASVARAAELAGFASVTHFAKAFRHAYGCAPSKWRTGA